MAVAVLPRMYCPLRIHPFRRITKAQEIPSLRFSVYMLELPVTSPFTMRGAICTGRSCPKRTDPLGIYRCFYQTARCTLPERRQRVQTLMRFTSPFTTARTR